MEFPAELVKAGLITRLILVIPPHIFFTSLRYFLIIIILGKEIYDRSWKLKRYEGINGFLTSPCVKTQRHTTRIMIR